MHIHTEIHIVRQMSIVIVAIAKNKSRIVSLPRRKSLSNESDVPLIEPLYIGSV